jgi:hypothetical protein
VSNPYVSAPYAERQYYVPIASINTAEENKDQRELKI